MSSAARTAASGASLQRQRRAEHGHQPVADHLVDHPALAADGVEHQRVVGVEQLDRLVGRLRGGQGGEAADVGEHHGGADLPAAEGEAGLLQVGRHLRRGESPHQFFCTSRSRFSPGWRSRAPSAEPD